MERMNFVVIATLLILPVGMCVFRISGVDRSSKVDLKLLMVNQTIGECHACKVYVDSFKMGLERTSKGKHAGGYVLIEDQFMSYSRSEMRLIDINKELCKEQISYSKQCHDMAEKAKEFIKEWWSTDPDKSNDLHSYICIDKLKVCCPKYHYGKDCTPCPGDHNNLCSGNGKCRGEGTRKGNGICSCDAGYTGVNCDECSTGYYLSYKDNSKMLCSPCHRSCKGGCTHGSQKDCFACESGYSFDPDQGCLDINECNDVSLCSREQFCLNLQGSYKCVRCAEACDGCHGNGPDMCRQCSKGYVLKKDFCVREMVNGIDSIEIMTNTRYMTYIGLLIATAILLPKSTRLGSLVGAFVLSYMFVAEYYCMINGHQGLVNLKLFDLSVFLRDM